MTDVIGDSSHSSKEHTRRAEGTAHDSAAIFSGGLDSTTLVYDMVQGGYTPHLISFNYGQRHSKELEYAERTAHKLNLRHDVIELQHLTHLISNSALTSFDGYDVKNEKEVHEIEVPEGHYAEDNMKLTVVPNRNMIMLSIAAGIAVNNGYVALGTGVHAGDHFVYPDCRPRFLFAANAAIVAGNLGFGAIKDADENQMLMEFIYAPYSYLSKADIAYRAMQLDVPFAETWSCYKGGEYHCGKCGTCVERLEAIDQANRQREKDELPTVADNTVYEDREYWKQVIKK
jgi:7-cyano-7-deazaguanine synthase